jgi:quercetin dioxygenase-like cupin family protein
MKTKIFVLSATTFGAILLGGGVVLAEPPSGFTATIVGDGKIAKASEISANGIEFTSRKNARVIVQTGEFVGGGQSGWHTHPGLTVVTVIDGTVSNRTGCAAAVVYAKGESFVEPPDTPISVNNTSATVLAHVVATLVVPDGMAPRTNVTAPVCPPAED